MMTITIEIWTVAHKVKVDYIKIPDYVQITVLARNNISHYLKKHLILPVFKLCFGQYLKAAFIIHLNFIKKIRFISKYLIQKRGKSFRSLTAALLVGETYYQRIERTH